MGGDLTAEVTPALPGEALCDDLERLKEEGFNAIVIIVQYKPDRFGNVEEVVYRHPNLVLSEVFKKVWKK